MLGEHYKVLAQGLAGSLDADLAKALSAIEAHQRHAARSAETLISAASEHVAKVCQTAVAAAVAQGAEALPQAGAALGRSIGQAAMAQQVAADQTQPGDRGISLMAKLQWAVIGGTITSALMMAIFALRPAG